MIHVAADGWRAEDLRTLIRTATRLVPPGTSHRWWLIDEKGGVPGWAPVVKNLRDNDADSSQDTVILTGSSAADLTTATSYLAGRRGPVSRPDRTLLPMGFRTFADTIMASRGRTAPETPILQADELRTPSAMKVFNELVPWLADLIAWWEIYLECGGFPQAVAAQLAGEDTPPLAQALFEVLQRDAFGAARPSEPETLALLGRLARHLCSPVNSSTIARDIGVSHDTLGRRLEDLATAYLVWPATRRISSDPRSDPRPSATSLIASSEAGAPAKRRAPCSRCHPAGRTATR